MSEDVHLKIISLPAPPLRLSIAAKSDFLWPCHAFSISMPKKKRNELNIFEETVLRLTEPESGDTEAIAKLTGLGGDLVSFIQNRLLQLRLLDRRLLLSHLGSERMDRLENPASDAVEYITATVFRDLVTGRLLPYLETSELSYKTIVKQEIIREYKSGPRRLVHFLIQPTRKSSELKALRIPSEPNDLRGKPPKAAEIIEAARKYSRKFLRHALQTQADLQPPPSIPRAEAITVREEPEPVSLHCQILWQAGADNFIVTDGCGGGFSDSFAAYIKKQDWPCLIALKEDSLPEKLKSAPREKAQNQKDYKYPKITNKMLEVDGFLKNLKEKEQPTTSDEKKEDMKNRQGIATGLYDALEGALGECYADHIVPEEENPFRLTAGNEEALRKYAARIGFSVSPDNSILQANPAAIKRISEGQIDLRPLLAMLIAGASNNDRHPFRDFAAGDPDFLDFALQLKRLRDPAKHGDRNVEKDTSRLEKHIHRVKKILRTLLPGIAPELAEEGAADSSLAEDLRSRRKAEINLDRNLGLGFVSNLPPALKEQLIRAEVGLIRDEPGKGPEIVNCLAAAAEQALLAVIRERPPAWRTESNLKEAALKNMVAAGFYRSVRDIPGEISKVSESFIRQVAQGGQASLGACISALFLLGQENEPAQELARLKEALPGFLDSLAALLDLRNHANELFQTVEKKDLAGLKPQVLQMIKTLAEVF